MNRFAFILMTLAFLYILRDHIPIPFFRLPGDLHFRTDRLHLFLPLTTSLLVSVILSLLLGFLGRR